MVCLTISCADDVRMEVMMHARIAAMRRPDLKTVLLMSVI